MSITIKNLESALAGESQAHIKYRYFAKIAREEGFEDVAETTKRNKRKNPKKRIFCFLHNIYIYTQRY